jgi:hypothetical protein
MPFDAWLRGPLRDVMDDALDPRAVSSRGLLDSDVVSTIANRFRRGDTGWSEPWLLMMLELWCREVLDAPARTVGDACLPPNATPVEPLRDVATAAIADGAR